MRLDVSYSLCSKLGSKLILFDEIMTILVLPDHFWILTAFFYAFSFLKWDPIKSLRDDQARGPGCSGAKANEQYQIERPELKMGYIDEFRRKLQSTLKIRV
jgi:hypothetical protein